jgi:hypothetical protein
VSDWFDHEYREAEFRYETNYDPDKGQWFARGYVTWRKGQSWDARVYTTPRMATEVDAKQAFCQWAIQWIDDNP